MEFIPPNPKSTGKRHNEDEIVAALALAGCPRLRSYDKVRLARNTRNFLKALDFVPGGLPPQAVRRAQEQYRDSLRRGFHLLTLHDDNYPPLLRAISDPPLVLYLWGRLESFAEPSLAIVGSRRATPYGIEVCGYLSAELARRGTIIVSGLARGIDAVAHRAALDAGGRTIAVLGSGLDVIYPKEHRRLAERIAETACVVSELPLNSPPLPGHFPMRNRIVSGLALGTVVIEAAERSGSLISARLAVEENREVFAVPGPINSPNSEGVHRLIQDGAKLVRRVEDIIEELRPSIQDLLSDATPTARDPSKRMEELSRDEQRVFNVLALQGAIDTDRLVESAQIPTDRVMAALVGLEIKGFIRSFPGGIYQPANSS